MRIHNLLPHFSRCMHEWKKRPTLREFNEGYYRHVEPFVKGIFFEDDGGAGFHSELLDLDWTQYRGSVLALDPMTEEARVLKHLRAVEKTFDFELAGEIVLYGAFETMDGYARFDRGTHRVFLGVDEEYAHESYLDVLIPHELTHVARESRPSVWQGWELNPSMTHDEFTDKQPVIEHIMGEGFSCAVSELVTPGKNPWQYAYQTQESLDLALKNGAALDRRIHAEISLPHEESDYTRLYDPEEYGVEVPGFAHYVWAWQWAKHLLRSRAGGDPRKLVGVCSKELMESALGFRFEKIF